MAYETERDTVPRNQTRIPVQRELNGAAWIVIGLILAVIVIAAFFMFQPEYGGTSASPGVDDPAILAPADPEVPPAGGDALAPATDMAPATQGAIDPAQGGVIDAPAPVAPAN